MQPIASLAVLTYMLNTGCGSWPRWKHLPSEDSAARPVGEEDSGTPATVAWLDLGDEAEPSNNTPPDSVDLTLGNGLLIRGQLDGVGWDSTLSPEHQVTCDSQVQDSEFPPAEQGNYTADLDWITLDVGEGGWLCGRAELEPPDDLDSAVRWDLAPYALDSCANPLTLLRDAEGAKVGLSQSEPAFSWVVPVEAGDVGVLLAGFIGRQTLDDTVPWRVGLSLIADYGSSSTCPELPEEP